MKSVGLGLLFAFAAACGGATVASSALDASVDDGDAGFGGDADGQEAAVDRDGGFEGFEASTSDALTFAQGHCDPPCADGEYCFAFVVRGGGHHNRHPFDPLDGGDGDASLGCHAVPAQCAPSAMCTCLLPAIAPDCRASMTDCIVDDAGRPTVECIDFAP